VKQQLAKVDQRVNSTEQRLLAETDAESKIDLRTMLQALRAKQAKLLDMQMELVRQLGGNRRQEEEAMYGGVVGLTARLFSFRLPFHLPSPSLSPFLSPFLFPLAQQRVQRTHKR